METAFSLGSNLGDRLDYLRQARDALGALPGARLLAQSPVYETEPVGVRPEHRDKPYLNAVVILACQRALPEVSNEIHAIEARLGRRRQPDDRYAPRVIDIDMLYWGDTVCDTPELTLPHPQCLKRRFVCAPLADLRPALVLPGSDRSLRAALAALPAEPAVRRIGVM